MLIKLKELVLKIPALLKSLLDFLKENSISIYVRHKRTEDITREIKISNTFIVLIVIIIISILLAVF